ncbi:MAG: hypothetical protein IT381_17680 [Deltaproteobacteria bacterium]|nr:hypothetical protein [Deltaproteobacteria bacterium]
MRFGVPSLTFVLAPVLMLGACTPPAANEELQTQSQPKGTLLLKPLGSARIEADKNADITLNLVATYIEVGPAADIEVDVQFSGAAQGELRTGSYRTTEQGFLAIPYHTPEAENLTVIIRCKSGNAPTINFTVVVAKDTVKLDWAGKKPHLIKKETDDELRVNATNQRGAPVSGVEVVVELIGKSDFGAGFFAHTTAWTDGSGMARFPFAAGTAITSYQVRATSPRLNEAKLEVVVAESLPSTMACSFTSDCAPGDVCTNGLCQAGSRRCRGGHPEDCPEGYSCSTANICEYGGCSGASCVPPGASIDVSGRWRTQYLFDFSETLGFLTKLADPIAKIDTLLQGKLPVDIPIFGPVIELMLTELIRAYVPDWAPKLATALNDLFTALGDVNIFGRMDLKPQAMGGNVLDGEEVWEYVEVKIASFCPRRQSDPQWPTCAKVNIQLSPNLGSDVTAKATAKPFTAKIEGVTLTMNHREAELEMRKFISVLVDLIGNIASNGRAKTTEEMVVLIVDCPGLQEAADEIACDVTNGSTCHLTWWNTVCTALAGALGTFIANEIDKVPLTWTLVDFTQVSTAKDTRPPATKADVLENGTISGTTNFFVGRPMTGTFKAVR